MGPDFIRFAEARSGRSLRWWQRLVATRLLEVDAAGELVWEGMVLSMARQLGKSWLLRELMLWRIHQADRFGEPQDCLHTGKDIAVCKEVQRPARIWAKSQPDLYKVREVNGQESIEYLPDGSRWMLKAKGAPYGYGVSLAAVDEAWKVKQEEVDDGITPTLVERVQTQKLLVSTAHRLAEGLMVNARRLALEQLEDGDGDLLIEWSTPQGVALDDVQGWRQASPHWTPKRERLIRQQYQAAQTGDVRDPDEPDPLESFRAQWLNQWPNRTGVAGPTEPLLPSGLWSFLCEPDLQWDSPLFVALEDGWGESAAVAVAALLDDGRVQVDGWLCPDWDAAVADLEWLVSAQRVRQLFVGASMLSRMPLRMFPRPLTAGTAETRVALPLLRDLAGGGMLVHDETTAEPRHPDLSGLDDAVTRARVKQLPSGLSLATAADMHLVKAVCWAVNAAHKPLRVPTVY